MKIPKTGSSSLGVGQNLSKQITCPTNKFLFPPYEFSVPNRMISNFHLPYSTLLMMVSAFAGYNQLMRAYEVAIKEKYKFGTYGDAMLIL